MRVKNEPKYEVDSSKQATSGARKLGLAFLGFSICFLVAGLTRALTDAVFVALGSKGGSFGTSFLLAIAAAYLIYDRFSNSYARIGGRIALGVWVGSIVAGLILLLFM